MKAKKTLRLRSSVATQRTLVSRGDLSTVVIGFTVAFVFLAVGVRAQRISDADATASTGSEYLWYEAENMNGITTDSHHEPRPNASWLNPSRAKAPGWGINGPGVSAEWSQGGESEWNSIAASTDETKAIVSQNLEVPREGRYRLWVRYADWAGLGEKFIARIDQGGNEVLRHEFGVRDVIDGNDEISMYWGWSFAWDHSPEITLKPGVTRVSLEIESASGARRHVDCILLTNDAAYVPQGRQKPPFAASVLLANWSRTRPTLASLAPSTSTNAIRPQRWRAPLVAGRSFQMPWNISEAFWKNYDLTRDTRLLFPFNAEPIENFIEKYKGSSDVPIFASKLVTPVIYVNHLPQHFKDGSAFLRHVRETKTPFGILINYGAATFTDAEGAAALALLNGELRDQFVGWVSGESIGHVFEDMHANIKLSPAMSRREILEAYHAAYSAALERRWTAMFRTPSGAMWDKLIPAQSSSSTSYAHALARWGTRLLGMETGSVVPNTSLRIAFTRGAARQYRGAFLYYHAPNFGDTATTFTHQQNFGGPNHFFHSRYGASMGPSLSWYRKNYYLFYMAGASAIYLEQGFDQFFKPGPGEHPYQLNPLGRITNEFIQFAEKHPDRGTPYTPVAFLLDPGHGFEMVDYPHFPLGVSPLNRNDRALRELFGAAYHPALVTEGEPATADRQTFVNSIFGDVFDVLVASGEEADAIESYRVLVLGGELQLTKNWIDRISKFARDGGTVVLNASQAKGFALELTGVQVTSAVAEADRARCESPNEQGSNLAGQVFRYQRIEARGGEVLIRDASGNALVTVNRAGKGRVVFCAIPDLLGLDERMTPVAAHMLAHVFAQVSPVSVNGDVQHLLNQTDRGWVVTLLNNRGVYKPQQGLAQVNRNEIVDVSIQIRGGSIGRASEWTTESELKLTGEAVRISVPAGGVRIVELVMRR